MATLPREQLEDFVQRWLDVNREAERNGDWTPLADFYAMIFTAPLIITALSAPMTGERVETARWLAVVTGFVGVIVMVRPGSGLAGVGTLGRKRQQRGPSAINRDDAAATIDRIHRPRCDIHSLDGRHGRAVVIHATANRHRRFPGTCRFQPRATTDVCRQQIRPNREVAAIDV